MHIKETPFQLIVFALRECFVVGLITCLYAFSSFECSIFFFFSQLRWHSCIGSCVHYNPLQRLHGPFTFHMPKTGFLSQGEDVKNRDLRTKLRREHHADYEKGGKVGKSSAEQTKRSKL